MMLTREQLEKIIESHGKWLKGEPEGTRANLRCADLRCADLSDANLSCADLSGANLRCADLSGANLRCANLRCADLSEANLSDANLSGSTGLLKQSDFISQFEKTPDGIIVYKTFNSMYSAPGSWSIKPGSIIEETPNPNRCNNCGCGINVAPLEWVRKNYRDLVIWKCLIRWEWLAGVVVPYGTDGKFRAERVELIEEVPTE